MKISLQYFSRTTYQFLKWLSSNQIHNPLPRTSVISGFNALCIFFFCGLNFYDPRRLMFRFMITNRLASLKPKSEHFHLLKYTSIAGIVSVAVILNIVYLSFVLNVFRIKTCPTVSRLVDLKKKNCPLNQVHDVFVGTEISSCLHTLHNCKVFCSAATSPRPL